MQLRMAINRMRLLKSKSTERSNQAKKEIADMLAHDKERLARIRVQAVIFDDYLVEAYNMVELYCETVATRIDLINTTRLCPPDMRMAVCSLIFAAPKLGCDELLKSREYFLSKYGVSFPCECVDNRCINPKVGANVCERAI
jgi:vacuolar protein sorting-associated protein IST1